MPPSIRNPDIDRDCAALYRSSICPYAIPCGWDDELKLTKTVRAEMLSDDDSYGATKATGMCAFLGFTSSSILCNFRQGGTFAT